MSSSLTLSNLNGIMRILFGCYGGFGGDRGNMSYSSCTIKVLFFFVLGGGRVLG